MAVAKRLRRKPSAAYHHGDLRQALIEAAARAVARDGVDGVRVSALARQLGVTGGAPFRHFPTRQALLVAVAEEGGRVLLERMEAAARDASSPLESQRARGVAYVRFAIEEPGYFRVLSRGEIVAASSLLPQMAAASEETMDAVLGRHQPGASTPELVARSAGMLAAQALTYGLARMITDGLLGEVGVDEAARLAWEVTGVLGTGLDPGEAPPAARGPAPSGKP